MYFKYRMPETLKRDLKDDGICLQNSNAFFHETFSLLRQTENLCLPRNVCVWSCFNSDFIAFSNNESLRLKSHTLPPCNCISFLYYFQQTMILDTHQLQELTIIYLRWTYCFIICNIHWISFYSRPQISISLSNVQKKDFSDVN